MLSGLDMKLLSTHKIIFPHPETEHLLAIKRGKLRFAEVSQEIDILLENVEPAAMTEKFLHFSK